LYTLPSYSGNSRQLVSSLTPVLVSPPPARKPPPKNDRQARLMLGPYRHLEPISTRGHKAPNGTQGNEGGGGGGGGGVSPGRPGAAKPLSL
jgi:hypothetical protein